jgi:hypothetical protein
LYLTGQVGGKPVSLHAEGERVILTGPEGARQEVDLGAVAPAARPELPEPVCPAGVVSGLVENEVPAPGTSVLDEVFPPGMTTRPLVSPAGGGA